MLSRIFKYYGFQASVLPFCNLLETQNFTQTAFETGIAAPHGVEAAFHAFLTAISELDYDSIPGSPDDPVQDRSWMWQYCSEYGENRLKMGNLRIRLLNACPGFYQRGDPTNPLSIETSFLSLDLFQQQCNQTFPDGLPPSPQVANVNKYGGWDMNPSNVMFTNGECSFSFRSSQDMLSLTFACTVDPWRTMGLASIESNSPKRTPSAAVPTYVIFHIA